MVVVVRWKTLQSGPKPLLGHWCVYCSPGWLGIRSVEQAGLECIAIHLSLLLSAGIEGLWHHCLAHTVILNYSRQGLTIQSALLKLPLQLGQPSNLRSSCLILWRIGTLTMYHYPTLLLFFFPCLRSEFYVPHPTQLNWPPQYQSSCDWLYSS